MNNAIKATKLAKILNISRRTVTNWCQKDPKLAFRKGNGREYYIRLSELAKRPGMDPVYVQIVLRDPDRWVKAVDLAAKTEIPRRTVAYWCANRPHFAMRIGRNWYVDIERIGATQEQVEVLRRWAPGAHSAAKFLGNLSNIAE